MYWCHPLLAGWRLAGATTSHIHQLAATTYDSTQTLVITTPSNPKHNAAAMMNKEEEVRCLDDR